MVAETDQGLTVKGVLDVVSFEIVGCFGFERWSPPDAGIVKGCAMMFEIFSL